MNANFDTNIRAHLGDISCEDALELLLSEFHADAATLIWSNTGRATTPLCLTKNKQWRGMPARLVGPLKFWAGPPTKRIFTQGSLLTMLCDHILFEWATHGYHRDLVEKPPREEFEDAMQA